MQSGAVIASVPYRHPGGFPTGLTLSSENGSNTVESPATTSRSGEDADSILHVFVDPVCPPFTRPLVLLVAGGS